MGKDGCVLFFEEGCQPGCKDLWINGMVLAGQDIVLSIGENVYHRLCPIMEKSFTVLDRDHHFGHPFGRVAFGVGETILVDDPLRLNDFAVDSLAPDLKFINSYRSL